MSERNANARSVYLSAEEWADIDAQAERLDRPRGYILSLAYSFARAQIVAIPDARPRTTATSEPRRRARR